MAYYGVEEIDLINEHERAKLENLVMQETKKEKRNGNGIVEIGNV